MQLENKKNLFFDYAKKLFPNAKCELKYTNAFTLLVAVMLSAQTKDERVNEVTPLLFLKYPDALSMSKANLEDVEEIIKSLGLYKNKAKNLINMSKELLSYYNGIIPSKQEDLMKLSGVGRKTANVVLSEYFNLNYIAVDTHVLRVSKRLGFCSEKSDALEAEKNLIIIWKDYDLHKIHHLMIFFGRYMCLSKKPKCENCSLKQVCKYYKMSISC